MSNLFLKVKIPFLIVLFVLYLFYYLQNYFFSGFFEGIPLINYIKLTIYRVESHLSLVIQLSLIPNLETKF